MTVNLDSNKIVYQGNGSTTTFPFSFSTPSASDITVITVDQLGNVVTQSPGAYTIVLNPLTGTNPTPPGGTVTYPTSGSPLPNGSQLVIIRQLPVVQSVSLSNQSIIYPPVIEQELDYLTMIDQQDEETGQRAFTVPITDPTPLPVPPVAARANQSAAFDGNGNLVPGGVVGGGVFVSAAMTPVVGALTLSQARIAMQIGTNKQITGTYGIGSGDNGTIFNAVGSAFYTISLGPRAGFTVDFRCIVFNNDLRGKSIAINGYSPFILWPFQFVYITTDSGGNWIFFKSGRFRVTPQQGGSLQFFIDYVNGNDANDGLASGTQAFQTIQHAVTVLENECDGTFNLQLANGTHQVGSGVLCQKALLGSNGYAIVGNTSSPSSVIIHGTSNYAFTVGNSANLSILGVTLINDNGGGLYAETGGGITVNQVRFGACVGSYHMVALNHGTISVVGPYSIASGGNTVYHAYAEASSFISYTPGTVTIEGPVTVTYFIASAWVSTIFCGVVTFVNPANVTGTKYNVAYNAGLYSAGNTFPGNTAGTFSTGGQYA
jgi:hypothetical protein